MDIVAGQLRRRDVGVSLFLSCSLAQVITPEISIDLHPGIVRDALHKLKFNRLLMTNR